MIDDEENYRMIKILFRKYDKKWKKKRLQICSIVEIHTPEKKMACLPKIDDE